MAAVRTSSRTRSAPASARCVGGRRRATELPRRMRLQVLCRRRSARARESRSSPSAVRGGLRATPGERRSKHANCHATILPPAASTGTGQPIFELVISEDGWRDGGRTTTFRTEGRATRQPAPSGAAARLTSTNAMAFRRSSRRTNAILRRQSGQTPSDQTSTMGHGSEIRPERRWGTQRPQPPWICGALAVLPVGDVLHPGRAAAVQRLGDGDVGHRAGRRGAVPVLDPRRDPDDVARPDLLHRAALLLHPAAAGGDDQRLAQRVRVPRRPRARLEGDHPAADARRGLGLEARVDAHGPGEVARRPGGGRPLAVPLDPDRPPPRRRRPAHRRPGAGRPGSSGRPARRTWPAASPRRRRGA